MDIITTLMYCIDLKCLNFYLNHIKLCNPLTPTQVGSVRHEHI